MFLAQFCLSTGLVSLWLQEYDAPPPTCSGLEHSSLYSYIPRINGYSFLSSLLHFSQVFFFFQMTSSLALKQPVNLTQASTYYTNGKKMLPSRKDSHTQLLFLFGRSNFRENTFYIQLSTPQKILTEFDVKKICNGLTLFLELSIFSVEHMQIVLPSTEIICLTCSSEDSVLTYLLWKWAVAIV